MSERKIPSLRQTVPMGAQSDPAAAQAAALLARKTQPMGTPKGQAQLARDTVKDPPPAGGSDILDAVGRQAETARIVQAAQAGPGVAALRALAAEAEPPPATPSRAAPVDPGAEHRSTPLDMRPTLPRSEKLEARAVVVPAAPAPNAPVGAKIDVSRADLRRAPTQKITRRPNEYIPGDDSDVLGPAPGAKPPPGVLMGSARERTRPVVARPRSTSTANTILYALIAIFCVCAVGATVTWAVYKSRAAHPAPHHP